MDSLNTAAWQGRFVDTCVAGGPRRFETGPESMPIPVECPSCASKFRVDDQHAGKRGKCPKCKVVIPIPKPAEVDATSDLVPIESPVNPSPLDPTRVLWERPPTSLEAWTAIPPDTSSLRGRGAEKPRL